MAILYAIKGQLRTYLFFKTLALHGIATTLENFHVKFFAGLLMLRSSV